MYSQGDLSAGPLLCVSAICNELAMIVPIVDHFYNDTVPGDDGRDSLRVTRQHTDGIMRAIVKSPVQQTVLTT